MSDWNAVSTRPGVYLREPHSSGLDLHAAFEDTLQHPELTIDMALATVRLATQHSRQALPFLIRQFSVSLSLSLLQRRPGILRCPAPCEEVPEYPSSPQDTHASLGEISLSVVEIPIVVTLCIVH